VLHLAVAWGKPDFVDILLDNKADPTIADTGDERNTPLHLCAFSRKNIRDRKKIAHSLLDRKASIHCENRQGVSPLSFSSENGNWLQKLLGEQPMKKNTSSAKKASGMKAMSVIKPMNKAIKMKYAHKTKSSKTMKPAKETKGSKTMKSAQTSRSSKTRSQGKKTRKSPLAKKKTGRNSSYRTG